MFIMIVIFPDILSFRINSRDENCTQPMCQFIPFDRASSIKMGDLNEVNICLFQYSRQKLLDLCITKRKRKICAGSTKDAYFKDAIPSRTWWLTAIKGIKNQNFSRKHSIKCRITSFRCIIASRKQKLVSLLIDNYTQMRGLNDSARTSCGCAWMHSGCASAFKLNATGAADAARCFITSRLHHSVVACNNYYVDSSLFVAFGLAV